uniref:adenosylmethionine decarboxylase n=1 Tax=Wolfiporia cocos TaxID=81056 RepID=A0A068L730_9APHY|nr:S-adenosyl methionine decarboxylase [Wolfiporia cocos]
MDGGGDAPAGPFEGPEKLLEIWFAPSPTDVPDASASTDGRSGLRKVPRSVWADMLDIVKCKILSVVEGTEMDAYLLSESSLFVSPHKLILKTCGTTLNLLGLPRILEIARDHASLPSVYRCFYSRKAFMFPERQHGPHRDWRAEVEYLDSIFASGAAYTIGKVNGDHWLLYITSPGEDASHNGSTRASTPVSPDPSTAVPDDEPPQASGSEPTPAEEPRQDYTIEILMTQLSPAACAPFMSDPSSSSADAAEEDPSARAHALSARLGISELFPPRATTLDAYAFSPCGYSCNALLKHGAGEGYHTIHVTPEQGWSYASFECNVPLPARAPTAPDAEEGGAVRIPDLKTLIRRVVRIFQPARLTLTLFISSEDNDAAEEEAGESTVEAAQRAFKAALTRRCSVGTAEDGFGGVYRRTDKINYELGGYDLAFATFELRS